MIIFLLANAEASQLFEQDRREYNRRVRQVVEESWMDDALEDDEKGEEGGDDDDNDNDNDNSTNNDVIVNNSVFSSVIGQSA